MQFRYFDYFYNQNNYMAIKKPGSGRVKLPKSKKLVQISFCVLPKYKTTAKREILAIIEKYR